MSEQLSPIAIIGTITKHQRKTSTLNRDNVSQCFLNNFHQILNGPVKCKILKEQLCSFQTSVSIEAISALAAACAGAPGITGATAAGAVANKSRRLARDTGRDVMV